MGIRAENVSKVFGTPPTRAVSGVSVSIEPGDFIALTGRSGSGKSTLLYLLSSLDPPSEGQVLYDGRDLAGFSPQDLHRLRNGSLGFVFQFHYLLPELTALENVLMPAFKARRSREVEPYARTLFERFDLADKTARLPRHLSGGEQQRVAIARALVMRPKYLFADEPTGSLDSISGKRVMDIFRDVNQRDGTTLVLVTHEPTYAAQARRQIRLADGLLVADEPGSPITPRSG